MPAIQGMLASIVVLSIICVAYFVLSLIDGCALGGSETVFGKQLWAWLHVGVLGACGVLYIVYLAEAPVLRNVSIVSDSSPSSPPRPYYDLFDYYRMLVLMLVVSFFLSAGFILPAAFVVSFTEERFKEYLSGFPLAWIPMLIPLLANLFQLCRLWSKLEEG
jgi:hypothetical protein